MNRPFLTASYILVAAGFQRWLLYSGTLLLAVIYSGWAAALGDGAPAKPQTIDLSRATITGEAKIEVAHDPAYRTQKHYSGDSLKHYLEANGFSPATIGRDVVVEFLCADGYSPVASLEALIQDGAFLATADVDAATGRKWLPFSSSSPEREPGPVYLVWPKAVEDADHPWPYGITSLRIGSSSALFGAALPKSGDVQHGFTMFRENCMKCHSINGVGGTVGVELNVPRNVFEYWQVEKLPAFVAHPESFRRNGKMPPFEHLGGDAISEILKYIEHMKGQKIEIVP